MDKGRIQNFTMALLCLSVLNQGKLMNELSVHLKATWIGYFAGIELHFHIEDLTFIKRNLDLVQSTGSSGNLDSFWYVKNSDIGLSVHLYWAKEKVKANSLQKDKNVLFFLFHTKQKLISLWNIFPFSFAITLREWARPSQVNSNVGFESISDFTVVLIPMNYNINYNMSDGKSFRKIGHCPGRILATWLVIGQYYTGVPFGNAPYL